jgi:phosphoglycerol transferase
MPRTPDGASLDRGLIVTFAGMAVVALFLLYRSIGLLPTVMADEWAYNLYSRHLPFSMAPMPSYLYFWLFRQTSHCGNSFLECARVFNCVLFVAAAPFIYRISRLVATPGLSAFIALASISIPVNTYTTYYMPEAMYFTGFWVLSWFLLTFRKMQLSFYGCVAGVILACLSMVKVHALFMLPGVCILAMAVALRSRSAARATSAAITLGCIGVAFAFTRLVVGFLFAWKAGLHFLGDKYSAVADSSLNLHGILHFSGQVPFVLAGHLMGLALLFGVPLASMFLWEWPAAEDSEDEDRFLIKLYTVATIVPLMIVMAYYTVSVAGRPYESIQRMHTRYYDFALPLLFIVTAGELSGASHRIRRHIAAPLAFVVACLAIASLFALRTRYSPSLIDSPELWSAFSNGTVLYLTGFAGILALAAWVVKRRLGARVFLFVFLPLNILLSTLVAGHELRSRLRGDLYDDAGLLARRILALENRSTIVVVGAEETPLYRTMFQIDNPGTRMLLIPAGQPLDAGTIPQDTDWILVVGDHKLPAGIRVQYPMYGFALFRNPDRSTIRFSNQSLHGLVDKVTGLSAPDKSGRQSEATEVVIDMASPLPRRFQLNIKASAFGSNTNLPFVVRIGSASQSFSLPATTVNVPLEFVTNGDNREVVIEVPRPPSPGDIGVKEDTSQPGILLSEISIVPLGAPTQGQSLSPTHSAN